MNIIKSKSFFIFYKSFFIFYQVDETFFHVRMKQYGNGWKRSIHEKGEAMGERLKKDNILTIPNLMSLFRILLIPAIIWLYRRGDYKQAIAVVALSALTDVLDGKVARRFHMVSDVGKVLDPVADKLTQVSMIFCLSSRYQRLWVMILLFAVKEGIMLYWGYQTLKVRDQINSAKWYGKLSTVVLYLVMTVLFFWQEIPDGLAWFLIVSCAGIMLMSLVLYGRFYHGILKMHFLDTEVKQKDEKTISKKI